MRPVLKCSVIGRSPSNVTTSLPKPTEASLNDGRYLLHVMLERRILGLRVI